MNRETDTVFLQTLGRFIQAQVQLAVTPLMQTINAQNELISILTIETRDLSKEVDGTIEGFAAEIARLEKVIEDIPKPEVINGKDGTDGKDGRDVTDDEINLAVSRFFEIYPVVNGKDGANGKDGKDGADIVGMVIDRGGDLVVNLSNGSSRNLGCVVGRDGKDGLPGINGKDGAPGLGFDDFEMLFDGERTYTFRYVRGDLKKEFTFTHKNVIHRGVWRQGSYQTGDSVVLDGGTFIAMKDTDTTPGTVNSDWVLSAKRGREGKQGPPGNDGKPGKDGRHGRDLTQLGADGKKWG